MVFKWIWIFLATFFQSCMSSSVKRFDFKLSMTDLQITCRLKELNNETSKWKYCFEFCDRRKNCSNNGNWYGSSCSMQSPLNAICSPLLGLRRTFQGSLRLRAFDNSSKCQHCSQINCKNPVMISRGKTMHTTFERMSNYSAPVLKRLQKADRSVTVNAWIPDELCEAKGTYTITFSLHKVLDKTLSQKVDDQNKPHGHVPKRHTFKFQDICLNKTARPVSETFPNLNTNTDYTIEVFYRVPSLHDSGFYKNSSSAFLSIRFEKNMLLEYVMIGMCGITLLLASVIIIKCYVRLKNDVDKDEIPTFLTNEKKFLDQEKFGTETKQIETSQKEKVDKLNVISNLTT